MQAGFGTFTFILQACIASVTALSLLTTIIIALREQHLSETTCGTSPGVIKACALQTGRIVNGLERPAVLSMDRLQRSIKENKSQTAFAPFQGHHAEAHLSSYLKFPKLSLQPNRPPLKKVGYQTGPCVKQTSLPILLLSPLQVVLIRHVDHRRLG